MCQIYLAEETSPLLQDTNLRDTYITIVLSWAWSSFPILVPFLSFPSFLFFPLSPIHSFLPFPSFRVPSLSFFSSLPLSFHFVSPSHPLFLRSSRLSSHFSFLHSTLCLSVCLCLSVSLSVSLSLSLSLSLSPTL